MSLGDSLFPDRDSRRQQDLSGPEAGASRPLTPTERLFARTDANLDGEFVALFGSGGPAARAALEGSAAVEGPAAYNRFRSDPDAFGTVIGDRSRADIVGGASEALAYSKAYHAAEQEGRTPSVPGYGAPVQASSQDVATSAGVEISGTPTRGTTVGQDPHRAEASVERDAVRYEMPDLGPWVSTDPSNRLGSPYVTTNSTRSADASGTSGTIGRFFDSEGRRVGMDNGQGPTVGTDGAPEVRRYLVNGAGAAFLRRNAGVGSVEEIRAAGGAVYEIRGTYASYESIDSTFEARARTRAGERQESHAALTVSAEGNDVITDFGTVTPREGEGSSVGRGYTQSDFARIDREGGSGASVVFIAHDHPPDVNSPERNRAVLMNNPTGFSFGQTSGRGTNDYTAIDGLNDLARSEGVRGSEDVYGVLFNRESEGLVFYNNEGRREQVSTTMRAIRSIMEQ